MLSSPGTIRAFPSDHHSWGTPSELAEPELAGRFYLACRGIPDYLMTLVRGGLVEALRRKSERVEREDLARVYEQKLAHQRVLAEQSNPFIGPLDQGSLDRVQPADDARTSGIGMTPKAAHRKKRTATAGDYLGGR